MSKKNYPLVIQTAIERLVYFRDNPRILRGRSGTFRAMRPERLDAIILVLKAILQMSVLQFDGTICRIIGDGRARPATVAELSAITGLSERSVWRVLQDLKDLKLLATEKQKIFRSAGGLQVAPCIRMLTKLFWQMVGLLPLFIKGVHYAYKIGRLILHLPFKLVKSKMIDNRIEQFKTATLCWQEKRYKQCYGGGQAKEVCAICHNLCQLMK